MGKKDAKKEKATELEWLKFFYQNADFGPADYDVKRSMADEFRERKGKELPNGYMDEEG